MAKITIARTRFSRLFRRNVQGNARKGVKKSLEVDVVIGADGANSRVAKDIEAGDYEYAIAFQECLFFFFSKGDGVVVNDK